MAHSRLLKVPPEHCRELRPLARHHIEGKSVSTKDMVNYQVCSFLGSGQFRLAGQCGPRVAEVALLVCDLKAYADNRWGDLLDVFLQGRPSNSTVASQFIEQDLVLGCFFMEAFTFSSISQAGWQTLDLIVGPMTLLESGPQAWHSETLHLAWQDFLLLTQQIYLRFLSSVQTRTDYLASSSQYCHCSSVITAKIS